MVARFIVQQHKLSTKYRASDISWEKKSKFPVIFRSKFAEKSADFAGKKSKFAEKSADFVGNFGRKLRRETISKKQPILLDLLWQISLKSIQFSR